MFPTARQSHANATKIVKMEKKRDTKKIAPRTWSPGQFSGAGPLLGDPKRVHSNKEDAFLDSRNRLPFIFVCLSLLLLLLHLPALIFWLLALTVIVKCARPTRADSRGLSRFFFPLSLFPFCSTRSCYMKYRYATLR